MIKIYSSLTLGAFIFTNFFSVNIARASEQEAKKLFIVTAYYSPLPDQKVYLRGSYEADIKLNGAGIAGASGKKVFPGMLAAPKSYSFGTKVFLNGFGTGEVADRGGAIISLDNGGTKIDRIDIWMGKGEEGLKRALSWGKRTVSGTVTSNDSDVSIDLSSFPASNSAVRNLEKSQADEILSSNIWLNSDVSEIKELQNILKEMGFFSGNIDGIYSDELKSSVTNYQLNEGLIDTKDDVRAGYTGAKTRTSIKTNYTFYKKKNLEKIQLAKAEADKKAKELAQIKAEKKRVDNLVAAKVETHVTSIGTPKDGEIGQNVRVLQQTMKALGYFDDKDTAIFGEKTKDSIIKYQIDKGIIKDETSKNAGVVNNATLAQIKEDLKIKLKDNLTKDQKLVSLNI
ncbi:MAG: peptidoglycan-binding protein [Candidatus Gracilibacteria bacterium]|nr:peptidoglycan-binding protein [Candidatus Gracilibacteria bacterium]